jgi:hypothetical protein
MAVPGSLMVCWLLLPKDQDASMTFILSTFALTHSEDTTAPSVLVMIDQALY